MSSPYSPTDLRTQAELPYPELREQPTGLAYGELPLDRQPVRAPEAVSTVPAHSVPDLNDPALKPTTTDFLRKDAKPEAAFPPGAPKLRPFMRLPFKERAEFLERIAPIQEKMDALPEGNAEGPRAAALLYRLMAEVDELFAMVAEDPQAYRAWVESQTNDGPFQQLFNAYMERFQVGEAARSSS